jgi:hypothetical protein
VLKKKVLLRNLPWLREAEVEVMVGLVGGVAGKPTAAATPSTADV